MNRRQFTLLSAGSVASVTHLGKISAKTVTTQSEAEGFFTLGESDGRWWLLTPERRPFFSVGLNHLDPRKIIDPEQARELTERYGEDARQWIERGLMAQLLECGFNTLGGFQEIRECDAAEGRTMTMREYQAMELPFCHLVPFTAADEWSQSDALLDYESKEWEEWCDHIASEHCVPLANEPNLIGYFYSERPSWVHARPRSQWSGPFYDPGMLQTEVGRRQLRASARAYYRTTHAAIRRYDPHHLILGDHFEADSPLPPEVYEEALPLIDVLSFQDFRRPVANLRNWYEITRKPILLADVAEIRLMPDSGEEPTNGPRGEWYDGMFEELRSNPGCVGIHLCGSADEVERSSLREANERIAVWVETRGRQA